MQTVKLNKETIDDGCWAELSCGVISENLHIPRQPTNTPRYLSVTAEYRSNSDRLFAEPRAPHPTRKDPTSLLTKEKEPLASSFACD